MGQRTVQLDQNETKVWFQPKPKWGSSNHKSRSVSVQGSPPNPPASRGGGLQLPWDLGGHVYAAEVSAAISSLRWTASERGSNCSKMGRSHTYVNTLAGNLCPISLADRAGIYLLFFSLTPSQPCKLTHRKEVTCVCVRVCTLTAIYAHTYITYVCVRGRV